MADVDLTMLEWCWSELRESNRQRQLALAHQGVQFDVDPVVRQTWLEHILWAVAGEAGVLSARIDTQERIAALFDDAESNINRAKLLAPHNGSGH